MLTEVKVPMNHAALQGASKTSGKKRTTSLMNFIDLGKAGQSTNPFEIRDGIKPPTDSNGDPIPAGTKFYILKNKNTTFFNNLKTGSRNTKGIDKQTYDGSFPITGTTVDGDKDFQINTPTQIVKHKVAGGAGGSRTSIQGRGDTYEKDAAELFSDLMSSVNLADEIEDMVQFARGTAGAAGGMSSSDNEYTLVGENPGNKLKFELKTSIAATFGQAQWGFSFGSDLLPHGFDYRESANTISSFGKGVAKDDKAGQKAVAEKIAQYRGHTKAMNDPIKQWFAANLDTLHAELIQYYESVGLYSAGARTKKGKRGHRIFKDDFTFAKRGMGSQKTPAGKKIRKGSKDTYSYVKGWKTKVANLKHEPAKLIHKFLNRGFTETQKQFESNGYNAGYEYYKGKGDQFLLLGDFGIYSLDNPATEQLANYLDIPSFKEQSSSIISLRTGGGDRFMNMPSVTEPSANGAPFPSPSDFEAGPDGEFGKLVDGTEVGSATQRIAIGFALYTMGLLDDGDFSRIERIQAQINKNSANADANENHSREKLSRLFEWAVK